jgi:hypothetical protein
MSTMLARHIHLFCLGLTISSSFGFLLGRTGSKRVPFSLATQKHDNNKDEPVDHFKYYNSDNTTDGRVLLEGDALVKRKSKRSGGSGGYKILDDNRDHLPFRVELTTPDPYTKPEIKKAQARKNTQEDRKQKKKKRPKIAASLYKFGSTAEEDDDIHKTFLGDFTLDKSTTCGDIIDVADRSFVVQKARCQYKVSMNEDVEEMYVTGCMYLTYSTCKRHWLCLEHEEDLGAKIQ